MGKDLKREPRRRVTLRDIAEETDLSIATVSYVLNRTKIAQRLSSETRSRVEEAAVRLGYTPDHIARSLKASQSGLVGVMVFNILDPYCTRLLNGIQSSLMKTAYLPLIMSTQSEPNLVQRYWKLLIERRVEGIIVIANSTSVNVEAFRDFPPGAFVMVGATPPSKRMAHVMVDNVEGGAKALACLYKLGHRKIGVLRGPRDVIDSQERWRGVQKFARQVGLKMDPRLCPQLTALPDPTIIEEAEHLTTRLIAQKRRFTALLTFDDLSAIGAIRAFDRCHWSVPGDCSVIGFDDIPYAQLVRPSLTTMRQPLEQMGALAVDNLLLQIQDRTNGQSPHLLAKTVQAELVIRESTTVCRPSVT
jgi:DNA-binding LacI/PurR family transcriptional regulator